MNKSLKHILSIISIALVINFAGHYLYKRFDLTADKRYTLSPTTVSIVNKIDKPVYVDIYLEGNFPGEFKKLQSETLQLLEEFKAYNNQIIVNFKNPLEDQTNQEAQKLVAKGLTPVNITVDDKGKKTETMVFPWAEVTCNNKTTKVALLKNMMGVSAAEKVVSSVQHLEYGFANAINTVITAKQKKIAMLKGNGETDDIFIADFIKAVKENYFIGTFTLDSVAKNPTKTLEYLKKYDLAIISKPTQTFNDEEKQVLDQFIIHGGKTLWMVDAVNIEMDSLYNATGAAMAFPRDLGLNDMFFKYGIRIKPDLIKDVMATPIALATGEEGSGTQYNQYPWFYSPMIYPLENKNKSKTNPIVSNLDALKFEFTNPIELLKNPIHKTVLLQSSPASKAVGTPIEINLNMAAERPNQAEFKDMGNIPVAVLLEGKFNSVYQNRVLPFEQSNFTPQGLQNKMIVISDGDIMKNQLDKNYQPMELGFDKWTNQFYANKEFLLNCVNYLLDDKGLINIRNKEVAIPILDTEKVYQNYTTYQLITVGLPLVLLFIFGVVFTYTRKLKYQKR